jgi:hypothetical protein
MTVRGTTLVLTLSLAANAALLAVIEVRDPGVLSFSVFGNGPAAAPPAVAPASPVAGTRSVLSPSSVDQLLKGDASAVIARLRAAGFPRYMIRAIAQEKVEEILHDREMEVVSRLKPPPYWQARNNHLDRAALADMQVINRERKKMLEDLIGTDPSDINPFGSIWTESQRGGLSPDTYRKVDAVKSDYDDMRNRIVAASNGVLMPEDKEKLAYLDKQQAADLAAVISPDELLEYQMHMSQDASNLRDNLAAFNPTEDEFKAIYKVQQDFNAQYGSPDVQLTPDQQQQRQAHQADLLASIQQVLSPDRFADYKTDTDPAYANVDRLVQQLNLPPDTTQQVVTMQSDYTQQAAAINGNSQISPADKITQLNALADEATAKLTAALGARGVYAYQQSSGSWLQQLKAKGK